MRTMYSRYFIAAALSLSVLTVPAIAVAAQRHADHKADTLLAKLTARTEMIDAKIIAARKAGRVREADATQMRTKLDRIRTESAKYVKQQGFLSAAESASYNRTLDDIDARLG